MEPSNKSVYIHPVRICIVILLVLVLPMIACAQADQKDLQRKALYQQARSSSLLIATHALIYYGTEVRESDPRSLDAYRRNFKRLQEVVESLEAPSSLQESVVTMGMHISQLEGGAANRSISQPDVLIDLMNDDASIKKIIADSYKEAGVEVIPAAELLRELSERVGDLLFSNQARIARVVGEYSLLYEADKAVASDARINALFEELKAKLPEHAAVLAKQHRAYRFARGQLLGNNYKALSGGAVFYLEPVIDSLDALAFEVAI